MKKTILLTLVVLLMNNGCQKRQSEIKTNKYFKPIYNQLKFLFGDQFINTGLLEEVQAEPVESIEVPKLSTEFFNAAKNKYVDITTRMIHAWSLPNSESWTNIWETFACIYLARKMKWANDATLIEESIEDVLQKDRERGEILNLLLQLLDQYGEQLFVNTVYFNEIFFDKQKYDFDALFWSFSAAAEKDMVPVFQKAGIQCNRIEMPFCGREFYSLLKRKEIGDIPEDLPKVMVDQTHSYNFETYHLAYFLKEYGFTGVHSDRSLRKELYQNLDVIVTHQDVVSVPYTVEETKELLSFVKKGGGLLLIGNNKVYQKYRGLSDLNKKNEMSINELAEEFGFYFEDNSATNKMVITNTDIDPITIPNMTTISNNDSNRALIIDRKMKTVIACGEYGNGRIAVIGGTAFCPKIDDLTVKRFFFELFTWLGNNSPNLKRYESLETNKLFPNIEMHQGWDYEPEKQPWLKRRYSLRADFIWPEHQKNINGVHVLYAHSMQIFVQRIMNKLYPKVFQALKEFYKCEPLSESVNRIHFYPHWGSGYTWMPPAVNIPIIGMPCLGKADDRIMGIFSHEMTHAWGIPGPPGWEHCWTTFTDNYFAEKLKLYTTEVRTQNYKRRIEKLMLNDPELNRIDISIERIDDVEAEHLRWTKFAIMFEELSEKYGYDLMSKYIQIFRKYGSGDKEQLTMTEFVAYLSLAAKDDLFLFFQKYGTKVNSVPIDFDTCTFYN